MAGFLFGLFHLLLLTSYFASPLIAKSTSRLTFSSIAQYANFFHTNLSLEPSSLCAFYLLNSASFYFAWLGLWAIGAAPAMINVNISGDALVHSLKISGAETVLVDGDEKVQERFEQVRVKIETLGIRIVFLGNEKRDEIEGGAEVGMLDESLRRGVKGTDPFALFYTRYVLECKAILNKKRAINQVTF